MNYLIIGGSKSGKSDVGEKIALNLSKEQKVIYIATMKPFDKEDERRIENHIKKRMGLNFITFEVEKDIHKIIKNIKEGDTVLLDSITSLLTNEMFIGEKIITHASVDIIYGLKNIINKAKNTVFISDYIFNDTLEYDEITENFKKELAIINKELAKICDKVFECSFGNVKNIK